MITVYGLSVEPSDGVSINMVGGVHQVTFPRNTSYVAKEYVVSFTDGSVTGSTIYTVNSCKGLKCNNVNTNGHSYVDLDLPSGTLWATMNVGASSITDKGLFFAWGETIGYAEGSGHFFDFSNYKFGETDKSEMSKYNSTDMKSTLDLADDAASVIWGGDWHMPTQAQCAELVSSCTASTGTTNGVNVVILTSNYNGSQLVFPVSGYYDNKEYLGSSSSYYMIDVWASDVASVPSSGTQRGEAQAYHFYVGGRPSSLSMSADSWRRWNGFVVRGVLCG